jgi:dimethylglycine dehydrogenase
VPSSRRLSGLHSTTVLPLLKRGAFRFPAGRCGVVGRQCRQMRRVPSQGRLLARAPYGTKAATAPPSPRNCAPLSTHAAATTSSTPPSSASVVIIGGGVAGTSLAYQLAKRGVTDVVVLEKTELTAGSTWHAAGLTTWFNPGANARNLHIDSLNLFNEFEAAGMATGFHRTGSIRMLDTPERLDEAKRQLTMSKFYGGQEWELITPEEMSALHPLMQTEGLLAGLYTAGDGHIDPTSLTNCFVKAAAEASAGAVKIMKYTPVDELHSRDDRKWDVVTPKGTIIADRIVNCGGLWADEVARKAGVYLPLIPIEHQYVITGSVSAIETLEQDHGIAELPVLRDLYGSYYLRQEKKGLLVGPYESSDTMELRTDWAAKLVASTK